MPAESCMEQQVWREAIDFFSDGKKWGKPMRLPGMSHFYPGRWTNQKCNSSPLEIGNPKRKLIFQPIIFQGRAVKLPGCSKSGLIFSGKLAVSFRDGNFQGIWIFVWRVLTPWKIKRQVHLQPSPMKRKENDLNDSPPWGHVPAVNLRGVYLEDHPRMDVSS